MKGIIKGVNHKRSMFVYEDETGSCGYFEINGKDDLVEGDEISGNLDSFGCEIIVKTATNERYTACIEDCGISFEDAVKRVFNKK